MHLRRQQNSYNNALDRINASVVFKWNLALPGDHCRYPTQVSVMKNLILCLSVLLIGCSNSEDSGDASASSNATTETASSRSENERCSQIVSSLKSTNRNAVHVALSTLEKNNIETPANLDFQLPYKDVVEQLNSLAAMVADLDNEKLVELDKSLDHQWQIYSPIWGPTSENWEWALT